MLGVVEELAPFPVVVVEVPPFRAVVVVGSELDGGFDSVGVLAAELIWGWLAAM